MKRLAARTVFLLLASVLLFASTVFAQATIDTVAGGGPDGVPALHANLVWPSAVTVRDGALYLTAWHRVYRLDAGGVIHAVAGVGGDRTYGGDGLPALNGNLYYPGEIAFDDNGNLFIADTYNSRIRRVDAATGIITTFAGGGVNNPGNGGPATSARIGFTLGAVADAAGNLYFSDYDNHRVRKVDAATGVITTVAGTGICGFTGNGGQATLARICGPTHLALDRAAGILYMAELSNSTVRRINLNTGVISILAGLPRNSGLALDAAAGLLYISSLGNNAVYRYVLASGATTTVASGLSLDLDPTGGGLALDGAGGLFVASPWQNRVYRINLSTLQKTAIAGNGANWDSEDGFGALQTWLFFPGSLVIDGSHNLYVAENKLRRIDAATGIVSTLLATPLGGGAPAPCPSGVLFGNPDEDLYIDSGQSRILRRDGATGALSVAAGNGNYGFSGDGGPAVSAEITYANGGDVDGAGNIYFVDGENFRVRRVDRQSGVITTVAGNGQEVYGGDGGLATNTGMSPVDVGLDGAGNLYITDTSYRVLKVDAATGLISTKAGTGVRGYTGDGGMATSAQLDSPGSLSVDPAGNLTFSESRLSRIRRVEAASGIIDTIAGNGACCFAGDGGAALEARIDVIGDLVDDPAGGLYVVDVGSFRVRKLTLPANAAPVALAGADFQAECDSAAGAGVTLDGSGSTDPDSSAGTNDDIESFEWFESYGGAGQTLLGMGESLSATLSLGTHLVTLRVTDHDGVSDTDEIEVTVADTTAPEIEVSVSPDILAPPHNQLVPVHASVSASDSCGSVSVALVQVTVSEEDVTEPVADVDIDNADFGSADFDFELRAKRTGKGSGRLYTVIYHVVDGSGHETLASDTVAVRHDQRARRPAPTEGGRPKSARQH